MKRIQTRSDLQRQIHHLREENQRLQTTLNEIADIVDREAEDPESDDAYEAEDEEDEEE
jgi:hypothetical protein